MQILDIIIVNWNAGKQLCNCIESINRTKKTLFKIDRVVVIDNASSDDSLRKIECSDLQYKIIRNQDNKGFAVACNQGAKGSTAEYLLFLNPDTQLLEDSLDTLMKFIELKKNSNIGIVGIQLLDDFNKISFSCARFPTIGRFLAKIFGLNRIIPRFFPSHFMTDWDHKSNRSVDQVMGAFFLVRRTLFEKLGGFDERFFVYFEEVDFSLRALKNGWSSYYFAEARAYHKGGGTSQNVKAKRLFYSLRSRILYFYKHFNYISASFLLLMTLFCEPFTRMIWSLVQNSKQDILETIQGYLMLFRDMPNILRSVFYENSASK